MAGFAKWKGLHGFVPGVASLIVACCTGCGSSGTSADPIAAPGPSSYPAAGADPLTGFGGNIATWRDQRQPDPDVRLEADCCFGPAVDAPANGGTQDTWYAVQVDPKTGEVYGYSRAFPPHTSDTEATGAIVADELPPDATLVASRVGAGCKLFVYRSAQLASVTDLGPYVGVWFDSPHPDVYDPSDVSDAGLSTQDDATLGAC